MIVEAANAEPIFADADRMQQVIYNLLANAIKFTPKDGELRVEFGRIGSQFQISVSDTGEGISPDVLPHIFNRDEDYKSKLLVSLLRDWTRLERDDVDSFSCGFCIIRDLIIVLFGIPSEWS